MGQHVIKMPDIGEGIAQVELVEWFVNVGDTVTEDQVLADVMTDKATVEIPSPVRGRVLALGATPGQTMAVGSELIRLEVEGSGNVKDAAHPEPVQTPVTAPVAAPVKKAVVSAPEPVATTAPACEALQRPLASPAVRKRAWDSGIDLSKVAGSGPAGRIVHADLDSLSQPVRTPASVEQVQRVPVIGLRRKIAERMQEALRD